MADSPNNPNDPNDPKDGSAPFLTEIARVVDGPFEIRSFKCDRCEDIHLNVMMRLEFISLVIEINADYARLFTSAIDRCLDKTL